MNKYGADLEDFADNVDKCTDNLSENLKQGCLGLFLGAGVSAGLKLPSWAVLVRNCLAEVSPNKKLKLKPTNAELKAVTNIIKGVRPTSDYLDIVKRNLYEGISLNFSLANRDLLIPLSSLIVGNTRGNVTNVVTLNFDSVLEWYLMTNGLSVSVSAKNDLFKKNTDVEVTHLHGFLPYDVSHGDMSDFLIFTKEEFENRDVQYDYWKVFMEDFYRRNVFLTVGISAESLIDDVCKHLRNLDKWYEDEKILRDVPYGYAFITPESRKSLDKTNKETLLRHGIVPCTLQIPDFPDAIFSIAQKAAKGK